ncbi:MAG: RluA family pseudouridine synthase [Pseudomonadota bacterium]
MQSFEVLYEDNHLLVVDKRAGVLVQGDATGDDTLLDHARTYIAARCGKTGGVFVAAAHRLDRPVSGVVVLARTSKAASRLADAFRRGVVGKEYVAVVHGRPPAAAGEVKTWLLKDPGTNRVTSHAGEVPGSKCAHTRYRLLRAVGDRCLVALEPVTGRSHQLRVHLQVLGCPVVGDLRYGPGPGLGPMILLHCRQIGIPHPIGGATVRFEAPIPTPWLKVAGDLLE